MKEEEKLTIPGCGELSNGRRCFVLVFIPE